jgi:uncharacterized coiled-coil protein SlyX
MEIAWLGGIRERNSKTQNQGEGMLKRIIFTVSVVFSAIHGHTALAVETGSVPQLPPSLNPVVLPPVTEPQPWVPGLDPNVIGPTELCREYYIMIEGYLKQLADAEQSLQKANTTLAVSVASLERLQTSLTGIIVALQSDPNNATLLARKAEFQAAIAEANHGIAQLRKEIQTLQDTIFFLHARIRSLQLAYDSHGCGPMDIFVFD